MEYMPVKESTQGKILCCDCGVAIDPNPSHQCLACIRTKNDITKGIPKTGTLVFCRECERYFDPPTLWITAGLESKELLRLCLKKVRGLTGVRMVDAGFIWTEPHSKRIKVRLVVQKEIVTGAILQQDFIIEFTIQNQMCTDCHAVEAKDYWNAIIQVRQKTDHKKTFFYLEQLILKHNVHKKALGISPNTGGLDFFFANEQSATQMIDFFQSVVPCRYFRSKKLKSHDIHSNTYNYKHSFSCEIVPVSKDSIVCLPPKVAHNYGGIGQICIVFRITNHVYLIDPFTAQITEVSSSNYWRNPFKAIGTSKHLVEFIVIDVNDAEAKTFKGQGHVSNRHNVCEAWVQRASELGSSDTLFTRSHLGRLLKIGDSVHGFDLKNCNSNDDSLDNLDLSSMPDVILVKKMYPDKSLRNRRRKWKLRHLELANEDTTSQNKDYMDFLEDLEEDPQIRANVNIYKNPDKINSEFSEAEDDAPTVGIEEMLEDLNVDECPDDEDCPDDSGAASTAME